jgi:2',3'-cyclic-nucleotide 2'-phosphodiesterase (5'-nucleotidase family)
MTAKILPWALAPLAALAIGCRPTFPPGHWMPGPVKTDKHLTILQINDVYRIEGIEGGRKGGLARVRALRKQLEAKGGPVLVLHAGDLLFPSVMSKYLDARPMIEVLNLLDGDAAARDDRLVATFGNHEFDSPDPGVLLGRLAQSDFTWVSTNTRYVGAKGSPGELFGARVPNVHEVIRTNLDGLELCIIGITTDVQPRDYVSYLYADGHAPDDLVQRSLDYCTAQWTQLRVALTHQDLDDDVRLAQRFPELDLVVGGHEHLFLERQVGRAWITKADADAITAVVHDVTFEHGRGETTHRKVVLDESFPKDPQVDAAVEGWKRALAAAYKEQTGKDLFEKVGETEHLLEGIEPAVRGRETALGDFLADVMQARMGTDVALLNGGAIRLNDNIVPGPVTRYDLEGVFYFKESLVTFEVTGAELLEALRYGVAKVHAGSGRFLQVSSIRFRYHPGGTADHPTYRVDAADVEVRPRGASSFAPLDLGRRYSVATLSYARGDLCEHAVASCKGRSLPAGTVDWRQATEEALAALPGHRITTQVDGRIVRAEN